MLFLRLTKDARTAPAISGKLAMKPQIRESNIVPADEVTISSPPIRRQVLNIKATLEYLA
jgi:hypothetical protein